ncbi:hypothetical protein [Glycomyces buryatensis]|uniref:Uncharacterized protein n=1 Tax=Glycomyces buryatensis TaxID=2570927 RepID=A0A4S8PZU1_9ACTN|nr:hypothetical protein [Glycomyces buryatensis]THV35695.1 hypothetical protein FAB82_22735 [Glycomyces buryatensis]
MPAFDKHLKHLGLGLVTIAGLFAIVGLSAASVTLRALLETGQVDAIGLVFMLLAVIFGLAGLGGLIFAGRFLAQAAQAVSSLGPLSNLLDQIPDMEHPGHDHHH